MAKIVKNGKKIVKNGQNCQKWSKLSKMVKIVKNGQNCHQGSKIVINGQNFQIDTQ